MVYFMEQKMPVYLLCIPVTRLYPGTQQTESGAAPLLLESCQ